MQGKFEIYEIRVGMQDLTPIDDDTIRTILDDYEEKDSIIRIFAIGNFPFSSSFSLEEKLDYYKSLADQIGNILGVTYTEEEKIIYSLYSISRYIYDANVPGQLDKAKQVISLYEDAIQIEIDSDVAWFARQCVKYKLLDLYASWPTDKMYNKMKTLMSELKAEKLKYDSIFSYVWETYCKDL